LSSPVIRDAVPDDSATIYQFIVELADYEKAKHEVIASEEDIRTSIFGPDSATKALICEVNGEPIGFAVYFFNYSTWLGKHGLYLEDLYVTPTHRGTGSGKALLQALASRAVARDCGRMDWSVLTWNTPAIDFYQSIGAKPQDEWIGYRLQGDALTNFAKA